MHADHPLRWPTFARRSTSLAMRVAVSAPTRLSVMRATMSADPARQCRQCMAGASCAVEQDRGTLALACGWRREALMTDDRAGRSALHPVLSKSPQPGGCCDLGRD